MIEAVYSPDGTIRAKISGEQEKALHKLAVFHDLSYD